MTKTSLAIQNTILDLLKCGHSVERVARQLSTSVGTVSKLRKMFLPNLPRNPAGRPRLLSARTMQGVKRQMLSGQLKTAKEALKHLQSQRIQISYQSVLNNLRRVGLHPYKKLKKPFLSKKHQEKRYHWAKTYVNWTVDDWKRVVFSDETKINLWNSDGIIYHWKRPNDQVNPFHIHPTVKHGGGHLMFWGCMTWRGLGYGCQICDGTMKAVDYVGILDTTLKETVKHYGYQQDEFIFQHDNDRKHTAGCTKAYLQDKGIEVLPWPAQSPDLNPIECVWDYLKVQIAKRKKRPTSIHELWEVVLEEWERIPLDYIHNLYESMPKRVEAVLKAKGGHTKF
jgi:hypothetical protein